MAAKVTGIGGVFFKVNNPAATRDWYQKHLHINTDEYGSTFEWREADEGVSRGFTQWSPFDQGSDYFPRNFMINYRVSDLEALLAELRQNGVEIVDQIETHEYGKFVHIIDGDGNRVELWEPVDDVYDEMIGSARIK